MAKRIQETTTPSASLRSDEDVTDAGYDVGGYRQGQDVRGKYDALVAGGASPAPETPVNPFDPASNIGQSWQAGYDAGPGVDPSEPVVP